ETLGLGVEAHGAVRRRCPDLALAVHVERHRPAEWRHAGRRHVYIDLLGLGIEPAQTAAAGIDVKPENALLIAHQTVSVSRKAVVAVDLEQLHCAGLAVHLADGDLTIGIVGGEPEIAIEIHAAVMSDEP